MITVLFLACADARRLPIKTYTTADGLARDRISCIVQDSRGFLWFCTAEGLSRFDGYRFTNYGTEHGLPGNNVNALLQTREGIYWVATSLGLSRFDPVEKGPAKFRRYPISPQSPNQPVNTLLQDRAGAIWAGTNVGLFRMAKDGSRFQRLDLGSAAAGFTQSISVLLENQSGDLWVGTFDGLYRRDRMGRTASYGYIFRGPIPAILDLKEDSEGRLWIAAANSLWRLDPGDVPVKCFGFGTLRAYTVLQAQNGKIWIGTSSGLAQWTPQPSHPEGHLEFYGLANGLSGEQLPALAEDRDGNLWMGTDGAGIMRLARSGFISYYGDDGFGAVLPPKGMMFETLKGELCFANRPLINRFNGRRFETFRPDFPRDISKFGWGNGTLVLQDRTGQWWIPTAQGLCRFPAVSIETLVNTAPMAVYRRRDGLSADFAFQIFEDSRGDIWIGTSGSEVTGRDGLALWERRSGRIQALPVSVSAATSFAEDSAGNIWVGCYNGELLRFAQRRPTVFTAAEGVPKGGWKTLFMDSRGRLWITSRRGLGRTDHPNLERPQFATYTTAQGLASNDVMAVTEDRWGRIYLATGRGIDRLEAKPDSISITKHYTYADGLASGELKTAYRDRKGDLWFETTLGFSQFTPTIDPATHPPRVLVSALQVGAVPFGLADLGEAEVHGLRVRSGQGPVRIDFVGLSFAPGETLRYQYQLPGVDRDWSAPTDQRSVVYGRLAAGAYHFVVRAVSSDGLVSADPARVDFSVLPPVWLSWWFLSVAALATAGLVYAAHRFRVRQILAVERVRTRIATDLHDDIGSSLSQISLMSELVRQRLSVPDPQVAQPLAEIATVAGEMVASLSDIVWAINPRHDRLGELAARMRRFALDSLGMHGVEVLFDVGNQYEHLRTTSDFRREVFLVFKEAVNNAARHAACTRASIQLNVANGRLELRVADNGKGFEFGSSGNGNGLLNMRRRAADLGGVLELRSAPGQGTQLRFTVPLPRSK